MYLMLSLSWIDVLKPSRFVSGGIFDEFMEVYNSSVLQPVCSINIGLR